MSPKKKSKAIDPYIQIGVLTAMVEHFAEIVDTLPLDPEETFGKKFWKDVVELVDLYPDF